MRPTDYPLLVFLLSLLVLSLSAWFGVRLRGRRELQGDTRDAFGIVLTASLTLLGLIIGFTFSMATSRYDQRKDYEEAEANAIGTEYVRADILPPEEAAATRKLLRSYLDQRLLFYGTRDAQQLRQIDAQSAELQRQLWSTVEVPAAAHPSAVLTLVVSGMNDVLNSQGYTQAAWRNRIPRSAWFLMGVIALLCTAMAGYGIGTVRARGSLLWMLPLLVSIALFLVADIDSPRHGIVRVTPENLLSLADSLAPQH
jgi:hypothetical protein